MRASRYRYRLDSFTKDDELTLLGQVLKVCTRCHNVLLSTEFYKFKKPKSGLDSKCKKCESIRMAIFYRTDKGKERMRRGYERAKQLGVNKSSDKKPSYYQRNKEKVKEYHKSAKYKDMVRRYYQTAKYKESKRRYYQSDRGKAIIKAYSESPRRKEQTRSERHRSLDKASRIKRSLLPENRLRDNMSTDINRSLRGRKNGRKWETLVGYGLRELMKHLEGLFIDGMSWGNYGKGDGKWHIDHIIPRVAFYYTDTSDLDFKRCWALDNMRPLWEQDNMSKSTRIIKPFQPSLSLYLKDSVRNSKAGVLTAKSFTSVSSCDIVK